MLRWPNTKRRPDRAFTLIELLSSMVLLIALVGLLLQTINHVATAWDQGESNKERMQDARAVIEFMSTELRAALLPVNRPTQSGLQFVVNPSGQPSISPGLYNNRDSIFWQAPQAADQTFGDVAEVGYFVRWDGSVQGNPRPILCRFFVNPGDAQFKIYSDPQNWLSDAILDEVAPAVQAKDYHGLFAQNILGLWVDCLDSAGQRIDPANHRFDSRIGYTDSTGATHPSCSLPVSIDLGLVMVDSRSVKRISPGLQAKIKSLSAVSASAQEFVASAQLDPAFKSLVQGLRHYQTRVFLQNSK